MIDSSALLADELGDGYSGFIFALKEKWSYAISLDGTSAFLHCFTDTLLFLLTIKKNNELNILKMQKVGKKNC